MSGYNFIFSCEFLYHFSLIAFISDIIISKHQSLLRSLLGLKEEWSFFLTRENVQESRLRQCGSTLLQCVRVYVPWGAGTMHQGGGVGIPAIREEGLANICACANIAWLLYTHMLMYMSLCVYKCTDILCDWVLSGCFCPEPSCKQNAHSVCHSLTIFSDQFY